jgi:hypothetical protein
LQGAAIHGKDRQGEAGTARIGLARCVRARTGRASEAGADDLAVRGVGKAGGDRPSKEWQIELSAVWQGKAGLALPCGVLFGSARLVPFQFGKARQGSAWPA